MKIKNLFSAFKDVRLIAVAVFATAVAAAGCGYSWQGQGNRWKTERVEKIYVKSLENNTLRPGVSAVFTSALVKEFSRGKRLKLVTRESDADAFIEGEVVAAGSAIGPRTSVDHISDDPKAKDLLDMNVASEYSASGSISVRLIRRQDRKLLWSQAFSHKKTYPGNNRFGLAGDTSALINASQEQMALVEIAQFVASDAYDTMLEAF